MIVETSRFMPFASRLELPDGQDITDYRPACGALRRLVTDAVRTA